MQKSDKTLNSLLQKNTEKSMTQLSDKEHKAQMEDMASFDEQMPCIGIFWYDAEEHNFFGVHKKELTPGMIEAAAKKGIHYIDYSTSSLLHQPSDIKRSACGRVAWNIDKFIVLVGKWAEPIQDELTELLEQEFSLPYFEFVYDEPMEQREESQACLGYPES